MSSVIDVSPDVRAMEDSEGAVLLDLKRGFYYSLNGVAAEIWNALIEGLDPQRILSKLVDEYDVPEEQLRNDLYAFLGSLKKKGLIDESR